MSESEVQIQWQVSEDSGGLEIAGYDVFLKDLAADTEAVTATTTASATLAISPSLHYTIYVVRLSSRYLTVLIYLLENEKHRR